MHSITDARPFCKGRVSRPISTASTRSPISRVDREAGFERIEDTREGGARDILDQLRVDDEFVGNRIEKRRGGYATFTSSNFHDGSVLRLLLEHSADINARTENGRTPLYGKTALQDATERGYDEVVKLLREHGAK